MNSYVTVQEKIFRLKDIFTCGQAFRWKRLSDGSYLNIAHGRVLRIFKKDGEVVFCGTNQRDFEHIWQDYFDFNCNYEAIQQELGKDEILRLAIEYGRGIRILNQDPYETIITFIISANSHIPRIMSSVEKICEHYGTFLGNYWGQDCYSFPSPHRLSQVDPAQLREIGKVGYRDRYIVQTSQMIASGEVCLETIAKMERREARKALLQLPGVGEKVADCILLFAFRHKDSFPVDVWIGRVMEKLYVGKPISRREVADVGRKIFGEYAGVANQYLFYYGREHQLGREVKK